MEVKKVVEQKERSQARRSDKERHPMLLSNAVPLLDGALLIRPTVINVFDLESASRALARPCWSEATTTRRVSFTKTHKK